MSESEAESKLRCEACGVPSRRLVAGVCSACLAGGLCRDEEDGEDGGEKFRASDVRIPGYEIEAGIASTGFSRVYRGWQLEPRRKVAVKILRRYGRFNDSLLERFQQEIQIGASLGNRGCVPILESGFANDAGVLYFTMEFMPGGTICEAARDRELGIADRVRLFLPLCATISAAHRLPVLHRDLKPGNILVSADGRAKVGDFGLAKLMAEDDAGITLAGSHSPIGTPVYMSPEQARGEEATTLSDVYGLGAVLYELLTNRRPFSEEGGSFAIMRRVAEQPMDEIIGLPLDLRSIVEKAMAKSPEERYQSADALEADLTAFLNGDPVVARRGQRLYRVGKRIRKHWLGLTAACGVVTLAAVGIQYHLLQLEERNRVAEAAYAEARSLLATMITDTAPKLTEAGRADAAETIATQALEFDWDLPIQAREEESLRNPAFLRMETFALNGQIELGYLRAEKAGEWYRAALAASKEWTPPPEFEFLKMLRVAKIRTRLLALEGTDSVTEFFELENSLRGPRSDDGEMTEALVLRVEILKAAGQVFEDKENQERAANEEYLARVASLEADFEALPEERMNSALLISRCHLADLHRDFLESLGEESLPKALDAVDRWKASHDLKMRNIDIGRGRMVSQAKLAAIQARAGALDEAVASFEAAVETWQFLDDNTILGPGTRTEERVIERGVEIMKFCTPTRPELTVRVVKGCKLIFDFVMPRVHRERAKNGFIPPELWPVYAEGRKYEARARLALGDLDSAWGAYSGCSGRLGELVKMNPEEAGPLLERCELVAEWAKMPPPPREPDHPKRVVNFLRKILAEVSAMDLTARQRERLGRLTGSVDLK